MKHCNEIPLCSAWTVMISWFLVSHSCPLAVHDAGLGLWAPVPAGGRLLPQLRGSDVSACFLSAALSLPPMCVFVGLSRPGGQFKHGTSIDVEKRNNNNVQKTVREFEV